MRTPPKAPLREATACLNYILRRTSRLVTQLYDQALKPAGVRSGQFNLMVPVALRGAYSISELADLLGMERSALARNLRPLVRRGWVTVTAGRDRRTRIVRLTRAGERRLIKAYPLWKRAQTTLTGALRRSELEDLVKGLRVASEAARSRE